MKAPDFEYRRAETLAELFAALDEHGDQAAVLAGGQSLVATLNLRLSQPTCLIDINRLPGLAEIEEPATGGLSIGALVRHAALEDPRVASRAPLMALALPHIAHPAIRNRGTLGGSLALADPAAEWPACMVAQGAEIELAGPSGRRRVAADAFHTDLYETARRPDEIITAAYIPDQSGRAAGFAELSRREGDFAIVGIAATTRIEAGAFADLRLVAFGCQSHPRIAAAAAKAAESTSADEAGIKHIAQALDADLDPMEDLQGSPEFKRVVARTLAARALAQMAGLPPPKDAGP